MSHPCIPSWERTTLTSREEVELEWLEHDAAVTGVTIDNDPVLDRIAELGIAKGTHYMEVHGYLGGVSLLTLDGIRDSSLADRKIRQTIISRGSLVRHYLTDLEHGGTAVIQREHAFSANKVVIDPMTPPLVSAQNREASRVVLGAGLEYTQFVVAQAAHLDLYASEESEARFMLDTADFCIDDRYLTHTQPIVTGTTHRFTDQSFQFPTY